MTDENDARRPKRLFYSYAHVDEKFRNKLSSHLAPLKRVGRIVEWFDRKIEPGARWADEIGTELEEADVIILLITPDFINSEYCWGTEVRRAIQRHERQQATLVPVIVRPVMWDATPLGQFQALPKDGKPVTIWSQQDTAWVDVAQGLRKLIEGGAVHLQPSALKAAPVPQPAPATLADPVRAPSGPSKISQQRTIFNADGGSDLPGRVVRTEGSPPSGNQTADSVYDALGMIAEFWSTVFGRDSYDGRGAPIHAVVNFGQNFNNAYWDGKRIVIGNGDGDIFRGFTSIDIVAKEYANGIVQWDSKLEYWGEAGTVHHSLGCVFASLIKQFARRQTAHEADWLLGEGIFGPSVVGKALMSLAEPGTAYTSGALGKDPQPGHMDLFVRTDEDSGGIHTNVGIPNRAFVLSALAIGGFAWEGAGRVWYASMRDERLKAKSTLRAFAALTASVAEELFGKLSAQWRAIHYGWEMVGVSLSGPSKTTRGRARTESGKARPPARKKRPQRAKRGRSTT